MKEGLPQDPMMRQLVQMARGKMLSRRATLLGLGGTAAVMSLASCAADTQGALTPAEDLSDSEKVLVWHNWPLAARPSPPNLKTCPPLHWPLWRQRARWRPARPPWRLPKIGRKKKPTLTAAACLARLMR